MLTSKLLMRSSRCLKRCLFRRFVPMSAGLLSVEMYSGPCANSLPNPISVSMFEQNTAFFIAKADAISSASMVDMAVRL